MDGRRTPAWWLIRFELAAGIGLTVLVGPLDMTFDLAVLVAALAVAVAGLAWMVRVIRGPRDEPPPWRYRDR